MSLTRVRGIIWPTEITAYTSIATFAIDAAGEKLAMLFQVPETGAYDAYDFSVSTVGTSGTVRCRLETIGSDGMPTGTLVAAGAEGTSNITATGWRRVTFGTPPNLTRGQFVAAVLQHEGDSMNIGVRRVAQVPATAFPCSAQNVGGTWTKAASVVPSILRMDNGAYKYLPGVVPYQSNDNATYAINEEVGNKIVMPFGCSITGLVYVINYTGTNFPTVVAKLYDSSDNLLASKTIPTKVGATLNNATFIARFNDPVTVEAGDLIRAVIQGTDATLTVRGMFWSSVLQVAIPGGGNNLLTTQRANGAGAWTDDLNNRRAVHLLINELHDGD